MFENNHNPLYFQRSAAMFFFIIIFLFVNNNHSHKVDGSKYSYLSIPIYLVIIWFQVFLSNTNNF